MLAILFGLSMDYQVFLVSRMHEEWEQTRDNHRAIRIGQAETGRLINAAALIMICVFTAFVLGGERVIAEYGVGLAAAVAIDAFVLRTVLVPSLMHLLGRANWWLPAWLERILPRVSIEGAPTRESVPVSARTVRAERTAAPHLTGVATAESRPRWCHHRLDPSRRYDRTARRVLRSRSLWRTSGGSSSACSGCITSISAGPAVGCCTCAPSASAGWAGRPTRSPCPARSERERPHRPAGHRTPRRRHGRPGPGRPRSLTGAIAGPPPRTRSRQSTPRRSAHALMRNSSPKATKTAMLSANARLHSAMIRCFSRSSAGTPSSSSRYPRLNAAGFPMSSNT